jgi:hypothetical protein
MWMLTKITFHAITDRIISLTGVTKAAVEIRLKKGNEGLKAL